MVLWIPSFFGPYSQNVGSLSLFWVQGPSKKPYKPIDFLAQNLPHIKPIASLESYSWLCSNPWIQTTHFLGFIGAQNPNKLKGMLPNSLGLGYSFWPGLR